jgi:putative NADH-flavin reductase
MSSKTKQKPEKKSPEQERNNNETASSFVRSPLKVAKSIKWHDAPIASTREIFSPSRDKLPESPLFDEKKEEVVAVFNANTVEGGSMVRALSKRGSKVIAIVRVFTSRNTKALLKLNNVVVKVADSHDEAALSKAVEGAHRAFLVTTYWERFESSLEEKQAAIVVEACSKKNVHHLVLSSFEDAKILREKGLKSQIVPKRDGTIQPKFEGMQRLKDLARKRNVQLTYMITSYVDQVRISMSFYAGCVTMCLVCS